MSSKEPVKYTVGGRNYVTIPLMGREAMRLDQLVTPIIFSFVAAAKGMSKGAIAMALSDKMAELPQEKFNEILSLTFKGTMFAGSDTEKSFSLDTDAVYDHFAGRLLDLYNVMVAAWEAHKLTPFRMTDGSSTKGTT